MRSRFEILMVLIGAILLISSCESNNSTETKSDSNEITLADMNWIQGTWKDESTFGFKQPPTHLHETWKSYPDSISGYGYKVVGTDTIFSEYICLRMINDKLTYIARPKGQAMVSFTLIESTETSWVFENKANDYPQQLTYVKLPNDSLSVKLSGVHNTISHEVKFKYKKE